MGMRGESMGMGGKASEQNHRFIATRCKQHGCPVETLCTDEAHSST